MLEQIAGRDAHVYKSLVNIMAELLQRELDAALFQRVLEGAIDLISGAQAGSITRLDEDGRFYFVAAVGFDVQRLAEVSFSSHESRFLEADDQSSHLIHDIGRLNKENLDARRYRVLRESGRIQDIKVSLMVPIRRDGTMIATLLLDNLVDANAFDDEARLTAEVYGALVGLVIKHLEYQQQLVQSEQKLLHIFQKSAAPMCLVDCATLDIQTVNASFTDLLGFGQDDVANKPLPDLAIFSVEDWQEHIFPKLQQHEAIPSTEIAMRTKTGALRWSILAAEPLHVEGRASMLFTLVDITEQKRTKEQLSQAIETVMKDTSWFTKAFLEELAQAKVKENDLNIDSLSVSVSDLTPREQEVLGLVAAGRSDAGIAAELGLARTTIRNYVSRLYQKLSVHSRAEAIIWARERGLVAKT